MHTRIVQIDPEKPDPAKIKAAARVIVEGGTVVFPTETVYGIGANAIDKAAVKKIYAAKGRPSDNPMIVHIATARDLFNYSIDLPDKAVQLTRKFWPGPLTVVVRKSKVIPNEVTAGLDTVAIRMPSHPVARELIRAAGTPVAAPSANTSGRPSATAVQHAIDDLNGKVDMILDGGPVKIGLESTVIDLSVKPPVLLRPGKITVAQIEKVIGKIRIHPAIKNPSMKQKKVRSPGMKYQHYSPKAKVILVTGKGKDKKISELFSRYVKSGLRVGLINTKDTEKLAQNIFRDFRDFDKKDVNIILVAGVEEKDLGLAVMNRLRRAASQVILT